MGGSGLHILSATKSLVVLEDKQNEPTQLARFKVEEGRPVFYFKVR